jgi:hypothetical protein
MSLKPGHFKTYSTPENSFWCCVGTGMENHTKYNDSIYFHGKDDLYVNLFIPSRLKWEEKGVTLEQKTNYPHSDQVELRFTAKTPVSLALKVRTPQWATGGLRFELNGKALTATSTPGSYAEIKRAWKTGDVLQFTVPMTTRTESTPDNPNKLAFLYGPLVLAGDLGPVPQGGSVPYAVDQKDNFNKPTADVPVLVSAASTPAGDVKRTSQNDLVFAVAAGDKEVTLRPFNELPYNYYNVYFDVTTPAQYAERKATLEAEAARQKELAARTLDEYRPGEQQSEIDHNQQGENTSSGDWRNRKYRHAEKGGWFSFEQKVLPDAPMELAVTYWGDDAGKRTFDILVDGQKIATETLNRNKPGQFFDKEYSIPQELTRGKQKVTVRFQAQPNNFAGGIFGAKMLKQ